MKHLIALVMLCCCTLATAQTQNTLQALNDLQHKAQQGDAPSQYKLAKIYEHGLAGIQPDTLQALNLYRQAAAQQHPEAQNRLGYAYYLGLLNLKQNTDTALQLITAAAHQGNPEAENNLGWLLMHSTKIKHDTIQAIKHFTAAAQKGNPQAQAQLATIYHQGLGVQPDTLRAEQLYIQALKAGLTDAQTALLAMKHHHFTTLQSTQALQKALEYYNIKAYTIAVTLLEIAIEKNPDNTIALHYLAQCHATGNGTDRNPLKALQLYTTAAQKGNPASQLTLADLLDLYPDTPSPYTAEQWRSMAAQKNITTHQQATLWMQKTTSEM